MHASCCDGGYIVLMNWRKLVAFGSSIGGRLKVLWYGRLGNVQMIGCAPGAKHAMVGLTMEYTAKNLSASANTKHEEYDMMRQRGSKWQEREMRCRTKSAAAARRSNISQPAKLQLTYENRI